VCGFLAIVMMLVWMWGTDPGPLRPPVGIGGDIVVPVGAGGARSIGWWGTVVLCLVAASQYLAFVFSYLYLWTVSPRTWPGLEAPDLPDPGWPALSILLIAVSLAALELARRMIGQNRVRMAAMLLIMALFALVAALGLDTLMLLHTGLRPTHSGYAALVYANSALNGQLVFALTIMAPYVAARIFAGRLTAVRRVTFDCLWLFWLYTAGQLGFGLVLVHGFPRSIA